MTLKSTARGYLRDAATAFDRAPAEVALAVLCAALLSFAIEGNYQFEAWVQMAVALLIALAFAWSATLLHGMGALEMRLRWAITVMGAICGAAYALLVGNIDLESEGWRALMLAAGVVLLACAAPAWVRHPDDASLRLRRINGRLLLRAIGIGLYGLALFGGLALALAAIDNLFELKLDSEIYGHTFGWIMLVLVPWVIVGGLESYLRPLDEVSDVARVVQRLTAFLVPPLLALYYLILFIYAVRILVTRELPKNLVSPMVLAAGLLTALAAILFDPAPDDTRTGQRALRWAPALFLPLAPLGMWALAARIDQYGWTEFRLLRAWVLVLLFVIAVLATLQLVRRRAFSIRVVPLVLGAVLVLGAIGPWSVMALARRDQQARLADALRAAGVDPDRPPPPATDTTRRVIARELYDRINNTGQYLESHFGPDAAGAVALGARGTRGWSLADYFRLAAAPNDTMPFWTYGTLPAGAGVALPEGSVYRVLLNTQPAQPRGAQIQIQLMGGLRAELDSLIARLPRSTQQRGQNQLPRIAVPVFDAERQPRGHLIVFEAAVEQWADSVRVNRLEGVLIVR